MIVVCKADSNAAVLISVVFWQNVMSRSVAEWLASLSKTVQSAWCETSAALWDMTGLHLNSVPCRIYAKESHENIIVKHL